MNVSGWPEVPKGFRGPFEANTSHPLLFVSNTAGEFDFILETPVLC